jgi:exoribonuclease R
MCSTIRPTYRLSYDNAVELLQMNVEEEADLYLLDEVAQVRREWRMGQVSYLLKGRRGVHSEVTVNDTYEIVSFYFVLGVGE